MAEKKNKKGDAEDKGSEGKGIDEPGEDFVEAEETARKLDEELEASGAAKKRPGGAERRERQGHRVSAQLKARVRNDYATKRFTSVDKLGAEYGVQPSAIHKWAKEDGWDDFRNAVQVKGRETAVENLGSEVGKINKLHIQVWNAVFAQVVERFKGLKGDDGKLKLLDLGELRMLCSIVGEAQRGQRLACGADDAQDMNGRLEICFAGLAGEIENEEKIRDADARVIDQKPVTIPEVALFDPDEVGDMADDI